MSAMAKDARRAMRAKAERLGGTGSNDPQKHVDASSWTPPPALDAGRKTGARPLRARIYKHGGAVQGDRAPRHPGKAPRHPGKAPRGGYASGGKVEPNYKNAVAAGRDAANRRMKNEGRTAWNEEDYNHAAETTRKILALNEQPRERASGGKVGTGPLSMANVADENKREFGSFHEGGYKRGGMPKAGHDVAQMKAMVHKHERHDHKGEPLTKLKHGGAPKHWMAEAFGEHPGKLHRRLGVAEDKKIPAKKLATAAHSDDPTLAKEANLAKIGRKYGKHAAGGRAHRAHGGRAKGKTTVNIVIAQPKGQDQAQMAPASMGPVRPPMVPPQMPPAPGPQVPPPAGMPPGGAAPMPMARKRGGRTVHEYPIDASAAGGEGRLEKMRAAERHYYRA